MVLAIPRLEYTKHSTHTDPPSNYTIMGDNMAPVDVCIGQKIGFCNVCDFPIIAYGILPTHDYAGMFRVDHDFTWDNLYFDQQDWFFRIFHHKDGLPWMP